MERRWLRNVLGAFVLGVLCTLPVATPAADIAVVRGRAVACGTDETVAKFHVYLRGQQTYHAITDAAGRFTMVGVTPGRYTVTGPRSYYHATVHGTVDLEAGDVADIDYPVTFPWAAEKRPFASCVIAVHNPQTVDRTTIR